MNQGRSALLFGSLFRLATRMAVAAAVVAAFDDAGFPGASEAHAQSSAPRRRASRTAAGSPRSYDSDAAAVKLVDGLFSPQAPADLLDSAANRALGVPATKAAQRPALSGKLVRNPKGDGNPPYAIIDEYGGVRRYVEPSPNVPLERYVGKTVSVRRDTGATLLASQLDLPRTAPSSSSASGTRIAAAPRTEIIDDQNPPLPYTPGFTRPRTPASAIELAAAAEPMPALVPMPADDPATKPSATATRGRSLEGEIVDAGPAMSGPLYDEHGHPVTDAMGRPIMDAEQYMGEMGSESGDSIYLDEGLDFDGCAACGDMVCGGQGCAIGGCGFGSRPIWYARGEYLLWWFKGMDTPPLVINGDPTDLDPSNNGQTTDSDQNGVIDDREDDILDNAFVVYGGNEILQDPRSGYRIRLGYWLDDYGKWAIDGEYLGFGAINETFRDGGDGESLDLGVGRPYIDASTGLDAVEDVSFPGGIRGFVTVNSSSRFQTAAIRFRKNLCCVSSCDTNCGDCVTCGSGVGGCDGCDGAMLGWPCLSWFHGGTRHVDVLYGFRWAALDEDLHINEDLETFNSGDSTIGFPPPTAITNIDLNDRFDTDNTFLGGEAGFLWEWQRRRWSLEILSKLAIGSTQQRVNISGDTTNVEVGQTTETKAGGLYTQNTNIGSYSRDVLSVMPEIGFTGGYLITERLRLTGGYTFLYWSRVVRPGDVIDTRVNPNRLDFDPTNDDPPDDPRFTWRDSDLWAHGLNVGLDYRW